MLHLKQVTETQQLRSMRDLGRLFAARGGLAVLVFLSVAFRQSPAIAQSGGGLSKPGQAFTSEQDRQHALVDTLSDGGPWGSSVGPGLTHTGVHLLFSAEYQPGASVFSLGPKVALTDTYVPHQFRWGMHGSWHYGRAWGPWGFFVGPEYHLLVPQQNIQSWLHEVFLTYGLEVQLAKRFRIGNAVGQGVSVESFLGKERFTRTSLDGLFRIYIRYAY
jgi:hypothetical protein